MGMKDKLTVKAIEGAKATDKPYKIFDGGGLHLLVKPTGVKLWQLKYRIGGREKLISFGNYLTTSLREARDNRDESKKLLKDGIDPSVARKEKKKRREQLRNNSFEKIAKEWHRGASEDANWTSLHKDIVINQLKNYIFPAIGDTPIARVTRKELLSAIKSAGGKIVTMHRLAYYCKKIFRYAVLNEHVPHNVALEIEREDLPTKKDVKHFPAITGDIKQLAKLLKEIDADHSCHTVTKTALRLLPLVATRPSELREATWEEIDLDNATWRIPPERMKKGRLHIVHLSRQAINILRELKPLTGGCAYVFPSVKTLHQPLSDDTMSRWFRSHGYSGIQTCHGFRATFSSLLNEHGWNPDAIERQLAHVTKNKVRAAYHRSEYLEERRQMLQAWADYLDSIKADAKVVPINQKAEKQA